MPEPRVDTTALSSIARRAAESRYGARMTTSLGPNPSLRSCRTAASSNCASSTLVLYRFTSTAWSSAYSRRNSRQSPARPLARMRDYVAAIRCLLTSDKTEDRALSGAVSTNKSYVFSRIHLQRSASQDILNAVGLMYF